MRVRMSAGLVVLGSFLIAGRDAGAGLIISKEVTYTDLAVQGEVTGIVFGFGLGGAKGAGSLLFDEFLTATGPYDPTSSVSDYETAIAAFSDGMNDSLFL